MHVGTVVGPGAVSSDVELAQLLLFGQLDVMAEVAVVPLVVKKRNDNLYQIRRMIRIKSHKSETVFVFH